jgi:vacuolar-type H+-ATPase subunit E/Vma4
VSVQRGLFDSTIDQRFAEFDSANPHIYRRIIEMLAEAKRRGKTRIGIKMLLEALRWEEFLRIDRDAGDYRINNSFSSRYARKVIAERPDLGALLETRRLLAA